MVYTGGNLNRREVLRLGVISGASAGLMTGRRMMGWAPGPVFESRRPADSERKFRSAVVEAKIQEVRGTIKDAELAWLFENCYPNTLDTTVSPGTFDGKPDTFVVTGDIDAMWLRDSSAQVWPYVELAAKDVELKRLLEGVIRRQTGCLLIDTYANAFLRDSSAAPLSWAVHDRTEMKPGVGERKWEIDSVCYPIRLAHAYWQKTGGKEPFDAQWREAMHRVVQTLDEQRRLHSPGPYHFQRAAETPTETLAEQGYGTRARSVGLIYSGFRPSDDACVYPFLIPSNVFAVTSLNHLAEMLDAMGMDDDLARRARGLAAEVAKALQDFGKAKHGQFGEIYAYEVDGFGNAFFCDDANLPSLLSLPYLGGVPKDDPSYLRTREFVLSEANPYFFRGKAGEGIGGPHEGANQIWPMSITMRALTSESAEEIRRCLHWLKTTHAGTGFMHESFDRDDPRKFTRPWFGWANSLFGELIVKLSRRDPALLA